MATSYTFGESTLGGGAPRGVLHVYRSLLLNSETSAETESNSGNGKPAACARSTNVGKNKKAVTNETVRSPGTGSLANTDRRRSDTASAQWQSSLRVLY